MEYMTYNYFKTICFSGCGGEGGGAGADFFQQL